MIDDKRLAEIEAQPMMHADSQAILALVAEVRRLRACKREALVILTDPEGDVADAIALLDDGVA